MPASPPPLVPLAQRSGRSRRPADSKSLPLVRPAEKALRLACVGAGLAAALVGFRLIRAHLFVRIPACVVILIAGYAASMKLVALALSGAYNAIVANYKARPVGFFLLLGGGVTQIIGVLLGL